MVKRLHTTASSSELSWPFPLSFSPSGSCSSMSASRTVSFFLLFSSPPTSTLEKKSGNIEVKYKFRFFDFTQTELEQKPWVKDTYDEYFSLAALAIALNISLKNTSFIYFRMPLGVTANSDSYASFGRKLNRIQ